MRAGVAIVGMCIALQACTHSGEVYDSKKHTKAEFSKEKTTAAVIGTALLVAAAVVAAKNGGGGGYGAYDYDWAWDYQPLNGQWVCRGKQTGEYAHYNRCSYKPVNDYTWPG